MSRAGICLAVVVFGCACLTGWIAWAAPNAVTSGPIPFPQPALVGADWPLAGDLPAGSFPPPSSPRLAVGGEKQNDSSSSSDDTPRKALSEPSRWWGGNGSPYVELDSWVYPALERLAALGYIRSGYIDMRPWTRIECARMILEARDRVENEGSLLPQASLLYSALEDEFRRELVSLTGEGPQRFIRLESLYTGLTGITGTPVNDSDHLGQTIINNYGRPYEQGFNGDEGFSGYATAGRFAIYVRGEHQHAPSAPPYSLAVRQSFSITDWNPLQPAAPVSSVDRFSLLDTYVSSNVDQWNIAFGKQSLWWGPGEGGALLVSDNAEPIYMLRVNRITDFRVPLASRFLGPFNLDAFFGKLSGNQFPPRPLIHGEKISFKPSDNLEVGFARTVEFGGVGRAMTLGAIWNSYVSVKSSANYRASANPGKRLSSVDVSYRVPFLRNWLTVYTDSNAPDDVLPLANPPRAAWIPGFYMPRIPGLPNLELRVEAGYTDIATLRSVRGDFEYFDFFYHDLGVNKGNLIGDWMGREGQGVQSWLTYRLGARNTVEAGYRHAKVAKDFIPSGETFNDGSLKVNWWVRHDLTVSGMVQYEKWDAPILAPGPQTDWTSSLQITFSPESWIW